MNETIYHIFLSASFFESFVKVPVYPSHPDNRKVNWISQRKFLCRKNLHLFSVEKKSNE
jgi:hypothetical protein